MCSFALQVTKLQESKAQMKKAQGEQAAKQKHLGAQIDQLSKTLRENQGKLEKGEAASPTPPRYCPAAPSAARARRVCCSAPLVSCTARRACCTS